MVHGKKEGRGIVHEMCYGSLSYVFEINSTEKVYFSFVVGSQIQTCGRLFSAKMRQKSLDFIKNNAETGKFWQKCQLFLERYSIYITDFKLVNYKSHPNGVPAVPAVSPVQKNIILLVYSELIFSISLKWCTMCTDCSEVYDIFAKQLTLDICLNIRLDGY
jgi:hypothetical protein